MLELALSSGEIGEIRRYVGMALEAKPDPNPNPNPNPNPDPDH